jgi:type IV pilus assembly protein PilM
MGGTRVFRGLAGSEGISITGLDVGSASVKAVRLRRYRGDIELVGLGMVDLGDTGAPKEPAGGKSATAVAIRSALRTCGALHSRNPIVVTAVGGPGVSIKHVNFPAMSEEALAESIRWEARKHVPFGQAEFVLDFQLTDTAPEDQGGGMRVLLTAAEQGLIDSHVALLAEAGIEPDTVDLVPLALMNEVEEEGLLDSNALAVIDLGVSVVSVAVYRKGGLFFARSVPMTPGRNGASNGASTEAVEEPTKKETKAKPDEGGAPARPAPSAGANGWKDFTLKEVRRSLTFYNNETGTQGIDRIYLTGGKAMTPGIAEAFREALGITVDVLNPLAAIRRSTVDIGDDVRSQGPRFALAMGLARRA